MKIILMHTVSVVLAVSMLVSPLRAQPTAKAGVKAHDPAALAIGQVAPDIEAADLEGIPFKLSDYRGRVVVLDFWGDW